MKANTLKINRAALIAAVEVCSRDKGIKDAVLPVVLTPSQTGLRVSRSVPGGVSARVDIACDGNLESRVQLDGANLLKSLRAASGETIEFRVHEYTRAEFKHARGKFTLPIYSEEVYGIEFPDESPPADEPFTLGDCRAALVAITRLTPFVSQDEARPNLMGACVTGNTAVATDGHRLSVASFDGSPGPGNLELVIEPSFAAHVLESAGSGPFEFHAYRSALFARGDNWALLRPRLQATFPSFRSVIPDYGKTKTCEPVTLSSAALAEAVSAVEPSASTKTRNVRVEFTESGLTLTAFDAEKGEAEYQIEATVPASMVGRKAGFNLKYVRDALRLIPGDSVDLYMPDALSPSLYVPQGETNFAAPESVSAVVMPMRL